MTRFWAAISLVVMVTLTGCSGGKSPAATNQTGVQKGKLGSYFYVNIFAPPVGGSITASGAMPASGGITNCSSTNVAGCGAPYTDAQQTTPTYQTAYNWGDTVTLTATGSGTNTLISWAGDCSRTGTCTLTAGADKTVVAIFGAPGTGHSNFMDPALHGPAYAAFVSNAAGALQCTTCHGGPNLTGQGIAPSCSACHAWPNTHSVGGTISGLIGTGLTLRSPGQPDLVVTAGATFYSFPNLITNSSADEVMVLQHPTGPLQTCAMASGSSTNIICISTPLVPVGEVHSRPSVAFDGTNYLAVWSNGGHAVGTRIDQSGKILDAPPIEFGGHWLPRAPAVAFNGTDYLVVWAQMGTPPGSRYAARVNKEGRVLDSDPIRVASLLESASGDPGDTAVTSNGTDFFVTWEFARDTYAVVGARISGAGQALDPSGIFLADGGGDQYNTPAVTSDGSGYLVVWPAGIVNEPSRTLRYARVSANGVVRDPGGVVIRSNPIVWNTTVAFNGETYFVLSEEGSQVWGVQLNTDGQALGPIGGRLVLDMQASVSLASDGSDFVAAVRGGRVPVYKVLRIDSGGSPKSLLGVWDSRWGMADEIDDPSIACNGGRCLDLWTNIYPPSNMMCVIGLRIEGSTLLDVEPFLVSATLAP